MGSTFLSIKPNAKTKKNKDHFEILSKIEVHYIKTP